MPEQRVRIAFVIDKILEPTGGGESQLLALLEGLDRARFDPHLFCLRDSAFLDEEARHLAWTNLRSVVSPRPSFPVDVARFARRLRAGRFAIVQTHFRDANLIGVLAAGLARVPCIISTRRGVPYWETRAGLLLLRQLNRIPTWFIANSRATRDRFVSPERIDPRRIDVVYNGIDERRFVPRPQSELGPIREELGLPRGVPVVGLVGNLRPVKGIDTFVRAAQEVMTRHPQARFLVVGQGPEEDALARLIRDLGVQDRVRLVGVRRDVPAVLQLFDVGVLASRFESFSNSILEYLASGLPVVVTDVGGAREVVRENETGFIVPPDSPSEMAARISQLLDHPGGARQWVHPRPLDERFSMECMIGSHEQIYERQLAGARARGRLPVTRP